MAPLSDRWKQLPPGQFAAHSSIRDALLPVDEAVILPHPGHQTLPRSVAMSPTPTTQTGWTPGIQAYPPPDDQDILEVRISCPGLGGAPLEQFSPAMTFRNDGACTWFGPTRAGQDVVEDETFALLTPRGPGLFLLQMAALCQGPQVQEMWSSIPGLQNARADALTITTGCPLTSFPLTLASFSRSKW